MDLSKYARKALRVTLVVLGATMLMLASLFVGLLAYERIFNGPTQFDQKVWLGGEQVPFSSEAPRLRMADGLIEGGLLLGKSKNEVDALLGPQTDTSYFRPAYSNVYWLGAERGFISIDSEWLVLNFNSDGTVSEARIVRD